MRWSKQYPVMVVVKYSNEFHDWNMAYFFLKWLGFCEFFYACLCAIVLVFSQEKFEALEISNAWAVRLPWSIILAFCIDKDKWQTRKASMKHSTPWGTSASFSRKDTCFLVYLPGCPKSSEISNHHSPNVRWRFDVSSFFNAIVPALKPYGFISKLIALCALLQVCHSVSKS